MKLMVSVQAGHCANNTDRGLPWSKFINTDVVSDLLDDLVTKVVVNCHRRNRNRLDFMGCVNSMFPAVGISLPFVQCVPKFEPKVLDV